MFAVPALARQMHYCCARDTDDGDVWDTPLLRESSAEDRANTIYLKVTCDGTVFSELRKKSGTAVAAEVLNLHPSTRIAYPAWILMGVLPGGCDQKETRTLMTEILRPILVNEKGSSPSAGFEVFDADAQITRRMFFKVVMVVCDSMGVQEIFNCHRQPSKFGTCPLCHLEGHKYRGQTTFLSAVRHTPP